MPWAILTPWALAGVARGVVVSTAAAAATARVIFIMGVLLELGLEVQRVPTLRVPPGPKATLPPFASEHGPPFVDGARMGASVGFSDLIGKYYVRTRPTGPPPIGARDLTTPHPGLERTYSQVNQISTIPPAM